MDGDSVSGYIASCDKRAKMLSIISNFVHVITYLIFLPLHLIKY